MIFERGYFDSTSLNESIINDALREVRTFSENSASSNKPTAFLSHKHDDLKDLRGVMGQLEHLGAKVYIDSMDNKMPNETSGKTALRIKKVIKDCRKFILLATDKAIESYWCNWELGIGDTYKYIENIAILPMKEKDSSDQSYKGNEYLQIYPRIEYLDGTTRDSNNNIIPKGYYICRLKNEGGRTITPLKKWLEK